MGTTQVLGSITLPGELRSVTEARRYGRKILEAELGPEDERVEEAVLAISEAVSNSATHSDSCNGGDICLTLITLDGRRIRVEVTDEGGETEPKACAPGTTATSGRGIALIEAVATRTGHWRHATGQLTYWFEV